MLKILIISSLIICSSHLTLILMNKLAYKINNLEMNYRGIMIPIGSGVMITFLFIFLYPFADVIGQINDWLYYCYITLILGTVGFIDDRFGKKEIKGLKGHLLYFWREKRISTGFVKLVIISLVGISISVLLYDLILTVILSAMTFAIWTNIINLLDVRPGRAIKGFWILAMIIFIFHSVEFTYWAWVIVIQSIILFIVDINEWGMLGDSGSNIFGGIIGFWIIMYSSSMELFIFFLLGSLLTIYAERKSFSKFIEKYPMIQRIDHWGRKVTD